ncbi:MAG TPA: hypothetical protein VGF75_03850 [Candidatus Saccharimonadales bacterium]|jgi:hypothetical protein
MSETKKKLEPEVDAEKKLQEIEESPVMAEWENSESVNLSLPYGCVINGWLHDDTMGVVLPELFVPEELRGHGLGMRLVKALTVLAKDNGAKLLDSSIVSPAGLRNREKVFGQDSLEFRGGHLGYISTLPLSVDQGLMTLNRIDERRKRDGSHVDDGLGLYVRVHLDKIDTTGWERPVEVPEDPFV